MTTLRELHDKLKEDVWRKTHAFSDDMRIANDVLIDPYARDGERREQLNNWLQRYQSCLFGRVAAARKELELCIITENDINKKTDEGIASQIREALLLWKRRSSMPNAQLEAPAHGFMLAIVSSRLVRAAPDEHLLEFAERIRDLWGCETTEERAGKVNWETLYLQHPQEKSYVSFTFGVDFFATQGDGRWWQDHRAPGGLLFTANSVGHMKRYRELYLGLKNQQDWIVQTAMLTINEAAVTPYGRATWLIELDNEGNPLIPRLSCPFAKPEAIKEVIKNKDYTRYGGYLHTDHSIRKEFFYDQPEIPLDAKKYLQDFSYLYDKNAKDHLRFVAGAPISQEEVEEKLGRLETWTEGVRTVTLNKRGFDVKNTDQAARIRLQSLLEEGRRWRLKPEELNNMEQMF